ncbi:Multidrug resistance-associated protein 5 [Tetrabaena socialis]|uniref:Multidrug resistance-associated protein 5 n=1 Tax=Tetrabaena socialis TaxID=47790 RepID=A0A2J7ZWM4_9CHLO|nr:Multidrug resistance-associated protein 5 [Tetrabaena socialis]|eukprot:PNH04670.1 Multidrug resistance-associated protein 5 [Tetrabaena socialis]
MQHHAFSGPLLPSALAALGRPSAAHHHHHSGSGLLPPPGQAAAMAAQHAGLIHPVPVAGFGPVTNKFDNPPCNTLFIGNLGDAVDEGELTALFSCQPGYKQLKLLRHPRQAAAMAAQHAGLIHPVPVAGFGPVTNKFDNPPCNTLFIGNLGDTVDEGELTALFSCQPGYKQLKLLRHPRQVLAQGGPAWRGYACACLMFAGSVVGVLTDNQHFQRVMRAGFRLKAVLAAAVHRQVFLLTPGARAAFSSDRGVNVSGGQKQRIAIARALYGNGDVVLLDDPLSALDARVGRRVFDRGIRSLLAASRTVLLATNQLQYVRQADMVLYLAGGRVVESGSPGALMVAGGPFASLMREVVEEEKEEGKGGGAEPDGGAAAAEEGTAKPAAAAGTVALLAAGSGGGDAAGAAPPAAAPASGQAVTRITQDESSGEGALAVTRITQDESSGEGPLASWWPSWAVRAPFIVNATVRDNILFGLPYDDARYAAALHGACLADDLRQLPGGDMTEMGSERERRQGPRAVARHASLLDSVSCMSLLNQSMNRWLSVRLEILGAAAALLAGVVAVEQRSGAGAAGLVMSYALQVTAAVSITVRTASMAENMLNAGEVQREMERAAAAAAYDNGGGSVGAAVDDVGMVLAAGGGPGGGGGSGGGAASAAAARAALARCVALLEEARAAAAALARGWAGPAAAAAGGGGAP